MENNIKVAWVHRVLSWLYAVICILLATAAVVYAGPDLDVGAFAWIFAMFGGMFALHHFTAKGAREKKTWARGVSSAVGILLLAAFPIGTVIGFYLLVNANRSWEPVDAAA